MKPCSDEFYTAFATNTGSTVGYCACGVTHFNSVDASSYEKGELERLLSEASSEDKSHQYADIGNRSVNFVDIGGEFVYGCQCDRLNKVEDWLWSYRKQIITYFKARSAVELKNAQNQSDLFKQKGQFYGTESF